MRWENVFISCESIGDSRFIIIDLINSSSNKFSNSIQFNFKFNIRTFSRKDSSRFLYDPPCMKHYVAQNPCILLSLNKKYALYLLQGGSPSGPFDACPFIFLEEHKTPPLQAITRAYLLAILATTPAFVAKLSMLTYWRVNTF
jgi:hypothetical protein